MATKEYNSTMLDPESTFERHVFHRDQFAHYLRWTHVLKRSKLNNIVADIGCGTGNLLEVLYRNRHKCKQYWGIDISEAHIKKARSRFYKVPWAQFVCGDVMAQPTCFNGYADIVCCFEVVEHVPNAKAEVLLESLKSFMGSDTILLLSTPCYDATVGAAENHTVGGEIREKTFAQMKAMLEKHFKIENVWGTFASVKDYKDIMNDSQFSFYEAAHEYFDSNVLSNLMAFMFPEHSRNCLWELKLEEA